MLYNDIIKLDDDHIISRPSHLKKLLNTPLIRIILANNKKEKSGTWGSAPEAGDFCCFSFLFFEENISFLGTSCCYLRGLKSANLCNCYKTALSWNWSKDESQSRNTKNYRSRGTLKPSLTLHCFWVITLKAGSHLTRLYMKN